MPPPRGLCTPVHGADAAHPLHIWLLVVVSLRRRAHLFPPGHVTPYKRALVPLSVPAVLYRGLAGALVRVAAAHVVVLAREREVVYSVVAFGEARGGVVDKRALELVHAGCPPPSTLATAHVVSVH
eukprot:2770743-Rhodomonas_salina.1